VLVNTYLNLENRRRTPTNPFPLTHLLIQSTSSIWKQYVEHDFVKQLGQGTLNRSSFVHFIKFVSNFRGGLLLLVPILTLTLIFYLQARLSLSEILRSCIRVSTTFFLFPPSNTSTFPLPSRLLGAKSSTFSLIQSSTQVILDILHEIGTHKSFCTTFGVTPEELENTSESTATTAYGAYLIDVGLRG
jgi:hydroxymethylpyrimidine/phosphomethylpyrimidine kinase / thiaminase